MLRSLPSLALLLAGSVCGAKTPSLPTYSIAPLFFVLVEDAGCRGRWRRRPFVSSHVGGDGDTGVPVVPFILAFIRSGNKVLNGGTVGYEKYAELGRPPPSCAGATLTTFLRNAARLCTSRLSA
jgi:hypothetical protein